MLTKTCSKCKEKLPIEMFYPDSSKTSGYKSQCKDCISKSNLERKHRKKRVTRDYYKEKYKGYKVRTKQEYPYKLKEKYYLEVGKYYICRESIYTTHDEEIIIEILTVENKPEKNNCNITFKQLEPLKEEIIEWSFPLSSLRQKWKFEKILRQDVIRRIGKKNID